MPISSNEKAVLRKLAEEYMEIATLPVHREKVELWKALNRCKMHRPMVCIDQLPWNELEIDDSLKCRVEDKFFRNIERTLRRTIYKWKHFPVDMVVEPYITIPKTITSSGYGLAPQAERLSVHKGSTAPSRHYKRVLNNYDDLEKITDIQFTVDNEMSEHHLQQAKDIFDGIAPVVQGRGAQFSLGVWDYLTMLIGIDEVYYEFFDNPDFIHACVDRLTNSVISGIKQANELMIHDDMAQTCHCSYIYTDELLPSFGQGKGPVSKNCWAFGLAQLFTSVSPQTMDEFEIPYVSRMAEYFGMIYYGCCDRLDDRLDIVKKIPNVKKVSCSPWSDRAKFAENIGSDIIMSNKPAPAFLAADTVDWDAVKNDLKYTVDVAKANNVNLELILKDISTVCFEPGRLTQWAQIAMEVVESC